MTIEITLKCPKCDEEDIRKNGINKMNKQNYQCKIAQRQIQHYSFFVLKKI